MEDEHKTKEQLVNEMVGLRQRITELKVSKAERKKLEEALRESEARIRETKESYDRIIDNADEVIFRVEAEGGHIIYANPAAERLLGYTQAEWLADNTLGFKIIHPDYVEAQQRIIREINTTKKPIKNAILGWIAKNGREIVIEYTIVPVMDEKGEIIYFESIGRDITERKRAEEQLKFLSSVTQQVSDSVVVIDTNAKIRYINEAAEKLFGYKMDELRGINANTLNAEPMTDSTREEIRQANSSGKVWEGDLLNRRKDGSTFLNELRISSLYDEQGRISSRICVQRDITERKQAEDKLRESRDFLERLTNSMGDTVFSVKMPERVIEWANDAFSIFGYDADECVGKTTEFLYPYKSEFLDFGNKLKKAMAVGKQVLYAEQLFIRKNGEVFPAEVTVTFHKEQGEVARVTSIVRDITERKQAEGAA